MTQRLHVVFRWVVVAALFTLVPRVAFAAPGDAGDAGDAGVAADAGDLGGDDAGAEAGAGAPLACDGSLCQTTNGSTCSAAPSVGHAALGERGLLGPLGVLCVAVVVVRLRRSRREVKP